MADYPGDEAYPVRSILRDAYSVRPSLQIQPLWVRCAGAKSSVDDFSTGLGVVRIRAATILRYTETHPLTGRFVGDANVFFLFFFIPLFAFGLANFSQFEKLKKFSQISLFRCSLFSDFEIFLHFRI